MKVLKLSILILVLSTAAYSQFNNPVLQFSIGIAEPYGDMKGTYYSYTMQNSGYQFIHPDSNLYTNHFGAKTGLSFHGLGKINFDKHSITRGTAGIAFNTFNTFEPRKSGNLGKLYQNPGNPNQIDTLQVGASFNYYFSAFSFSLGLEVAPLSFTNKVSPYFGARFAFNSLNTRLTYTSNNIDTTVFSTGDFRMGVILDAGIEIKFNKMFGLVLGADYNMANLLLKSTSNSITDNYEWGKTNSSINDEEGQFWSSIYNPVINGINKQYNSKKKDINWASFYAGVNIYFNTGKTKKSPGKK
jgi:hypothetical protein